MGEDAICFGEWWHEDLYRVEENARNLNLVCWDWKDIALHDASPKLFIRSFQIPAEKRMTLSHEERKTDFCWWKKFFACPNWRGLQAQSLRQIFTTVDGWNPAFTSGYGKLSPLFRTGFIHPGVVWLVVWDFRTINSRKDGEDIGRRRSQQSLGFRCFPSWHRCGSRGGVCCCFFFLGGGVVSHVVFLVRKHVCAYPKMDGL